MMEGLACTSSCTSLQLLNFYQNQYIQDELDDLYRQLESSYWKKACPAVNLAWIHDNSVPNVKQEFSYLPSQLCLEAIF